MRFLPDFIASLFVNPAEATPRSDSGRCDILFILKAGQAYGYETPQGQSSDSRVTRSTGLWNSATYVIDMLAGLGINAAIELVVDNNCIDRLVTLYNPRAVVIEALWVVPEKFDELAELHPDVKWCVRIHSEMPFIAGEAVALDWLHRYIANPNILIGTNSVRMHRDLVTFLGVSSLQGDEIHRRIAYLPNAYPSFSAKRIHRKRHYWVDIGCFGAVRPLKNHLEQAIAAIEFATANNKQLRFHINASREEMNGGPALANLRGMFAALEKYGHKLVEHEWLCRDDFIELCHKMDLGMQVSLSETFNIVGANMTAAGVPLIGSGEIPWLSSAAKADPTDTGSMVQALQTAWETPFAIVRANAAGLAASSTAAAADWSEFMEGI